MDMAHQEPQSSQGLSAELSENIFLSHEVREPVFPRWWRTVDKWSIVTIMLLCCIGFLLGLAASVPLAVRNGLNDFHYVQRQVVFGGAGILAMLFFSMLPILLIRRLSIICFVCGFISLFLLPFWGTDFGKSATRWYSLGFVSIQPSEFIKPFFIILSAWLLAPGMGRDQPPTRTLSFLIAVSVVLLLVIQPDFGQSAVLLFGWGVVYFVSGAPILLIASIVMLTGLSGLAAYRFSEHFARRINGYLATEVDPKSQLGYATNAIQEGGFFGVGVGKGQVKWILPDAHTDFIISVAAEEYGLAIVLVVIACYALVLVRSLLRLMKERNHFVRLAGVGLAAIFAVQAMINMGVAARLLPAKGMTLPFISYGGSSVVATGITVGMLLAFTRLRPQGHLDDILRHKLL